MTNLMPAIFFGHGNPMNALSINSYTKGWASVGNSIPIPKAILAVSAHWYIPFCAVTSNLILPTIHDFGGFPKELYDEPLINYQSFGKDAILSVPTPDHYLPFLYVLGLRYEKEQVSFPLQGVDGGFVSMLAIQIG